MKEIHNAQIMRAELSGWDEGYSMLTYCLTLEMDNGFSLAYGVHNLGGSGQQTCAAEDILRLMEVAGAKDWCDLKGKYVRIEFESENGGIEAKNKRLGHIAKDIWHDVDKIYRKEITQSKSSYSCDSCANENTDACDRCMALNESGSKPSRWEPIKNCSTCKYDYSPVDGKCAGCNVILPVYPHGIEVYQNWESKEPSTHKDCDEGRICPKCGKVMVLCEDEKTYYEIWECDGCGYKEED